MEERHLRDCKDSEKVVHFHKLYTNKIIPESTPAKYRKRIKGE